MVALTTARTLGGRARQTQGGETGQQLIQGVSASLGRANWAQQP